MPDFDQQLLLDLQPLTTDYGYGCSVPINNSLPNIGTTLDPLEALEIIAQPKPTYRPRYASEIEKVNRFIGTSKDNQQHAYPTIKVCYCP